MCLREQTTEALWLDESCKHSAITELLKWDFDNTKAWSSDFLTRLEYVLEDNPIKHCMASTGTSGFSSTPNYCPRSLTVSSGEIFVLSLNQGAKQEQLPLRENNTFAPMTP